MDYSKKDCKLAGLSQRRLAMEKTIYTEQYGHMVAMLRSTREAAGLTQTELAERLEVTQSFVGKCERGERRLDIIELRLWCAAIGVSLSEFVNRLEAAISRTGGPAARRRRT